MALYSQAADGLKQQNRKARAMAAVRFVGNRTFYNSGGTWYDSRFDNSKKAKVRIVRIGSKEYLGLLKGQPRLAKSLAQGNVVLNVGSQWYRFEDAGG